MFGANNKNTRMSSCGVFLVNFGHIPHFFPEFIFLTLNKYMLAG